jgi:TrmH family RNA methyltransferase
MRARGRSFHRGGKPGHGGPPAPKLSARETQSPELRAVFDLRSEKGLDEHGRLLLEGSRTNGAAHQAGVAFEQVLYAPEFFEAGSADLIARLEAAGVPAHRLAPPDFSRLSYKADGIVGVVRVVPPSLDEVLAVPRVVVLDDLSDPGNIGAVLRTANAWDASVLVVEAEGKLYHPKSVRAAMGTLFHTRTCQARRADAAARIATLGRPIVVLTPEGDHPVDAVPDGDFVLVLGNEKRGVHARWRELATARVAIPMGGIIDSLNVATSAAVMLWEAYRRRHSPGAKASSSGGAPTD